MNIKAMFQYESSSNPELIELKNHYRLEEVIADSSSEFEQIIAMREWVQNKLNPHGWDHIPEKCDSRKILAAAVEGKRFNCWYYSTVLIQVAAALGFKSRRMSVGIHPGMVRNGNTGHTTVEIWSRQLNKWVMMDADFNCHYEIDGEIANALDIHRIWVNQRLQDIVYIQGKTTPEILAPLTVEYSAKEQAMIAVCCAYNAVDYYFLVSSELRNNYYSAPQKSELVAVVWIDKFHPEYADKAGKIINQVLYTDNINQIYWKED